MGPSVIRLFYLNCCPKPPQKFLVWRITVFPALASPGLALSHCSPQRSVFDHFPSTFHQHQFKLMSLRQRGLQDNTIKNAFLLIFPQFMQSHIDRGCSHSGYDQSVLCHCYYEDLHLYYLPQAFMVFGIRPMYQWANDTGMDVIFETFVNIQTTKKVGNIPACTNA